ncbi:Mid1 [Carabus blaptoides fortunei]
MASVRQCRARFRRYSSRPGGEASKRPKIKKKFTELLAKMAALVDDGVRCGCPAASSNATGPCSCCSPSRAPPRRMHRASAVRPALLMATATAALLVARVHSSQDQPKSALETVNPWLYACDLVQPATNDDLKGACSTIDRSSNMVTMMMLTSMGGPGPPNDAACPPQCPSKSISSTTITTKSHKVAICDSGDRGGRLQQLQDMRLRHCCEHAVITSLRPLHREAVLAGGANCKHHLDALLEIDALAARISCEFTEVLTRYDCGQPYSIVYQCADCKSVSFPVSHTIIKTVDRSGQHCESTPHSAGQCVVTVLVYYTACLPAIYLIVPQEYRTGTHYICTIDMPQYVFTT